MRSHRIHGVELDCTILSPDGRSFTANDAAVEGRAVSGY